VKKSLLILILLLIAAPIYAQNYTLERSVLSSGGGHSESPNYKLDATIGQPVVGTSSSPNYTLESGFWPGTLPAGPGCNYVIGDINGNDQANGIDVIYGVAYFKGGSAPPDQCDCPGHGLLYASGDVNGNCSFNGIDITFYVTYLKGGTPIFPCADCPPAGSLTSIPGNIPAVIDPAIVNPKIKITSHPRTIRQ
jgi:hypothetical protein